MNKSQINLLIKQLKTSMKSIKAERDKLSDIINQAGELKDCRDTASYSLEDAIGALSELV